MNCMFNKIDLKVNLEQVENSKVYLLTKNSRQNSNKIKTKLFDSLNIFNF